MRKITKTVHYAYPIGGKLVYACRTTKRAYADGYTSLTSSKVNCAKCRRTEKWRQAYSAFINKQNNKINNIMNNYSDGEWDVF